jgi:hypothetical protein
MNCLLNALGSGLVHILEENFQIQAAPGIYPIRFETVDADHGRIKVRNHRVITGPGRIVDYQGQTAVEISNESK